MSANQYKTRMGKRDTMLKKVSKSSYLLVFLHILSQVAQHYLLRRLAAQALPLYYPPQKGWYSLNIVRTPGPAINMVPTLRGVTINYPLWRAALQKYEISNNFARNQNT